MRKFYDFFVMSLLILGGLMVFSCTKPESEPDPDPDPEVTDSLTIVAPSSPIVLEAESGASSSMNIIFKDDWEVVESSEWITITPEEGTATGQKVTVSSNSANEIFEERVGSFKIKAGPMEKEWCVVQRGIDGISLVDETTDFLAAKRITVKAICNEGAELKISGADWVSIESFELTGKAVEVEDTGVMSKYYEHTITLALADNPSESERRSEKVTLSVADSSVELNIEQLEGKFANRLFYRRSVGLRFTATWCGYCPLMGKSFDAAMEETGDRFVPVSFHGGGSTLEYSGTSIMSNKYKVGGYPSARFNGYADVPNYSNYQSGADLIISLTDEAVNGNTAATGIAATTSTSGNELNLKIDITAIETHDYTVSAFILENGIVAAQTDYIESDDPNYVHNFVVKANITEVLGNPVTIEAGTSESVEYNYTIPSDINKDNAYIVIYVNKPGTPFVQEAASKYIDYGDFIDNAITIGFDETVELRYEE